MIGWTLLRRRSSFWFRASVSSPAVLAPSSRLCPSPSFPPSLLHSRRLSSITTRLAARLALIHMALKTRGSPKTVGRHCHHAPHRKARCSTSPTDHTCIGRIPAVHRCIRVTFSYVTDLTLPFTVLSSITTSFLALIVHAKPVT